MERIEKKKKKLLELMSLARLWDIILIYETNLFVYTSNKQPDIEIWKYSQKPHTLAMKR